MSNPFPSGGPNPFLSANQFISNQYRNSISNYKTQLRNKNLYDALSMHQVHTGNMLERTTPTPANTGAPIPGYKVRGPVNPSTTGAPMPGTLKFKTAIHPITGSRVPSVPVKRKGANPTAPGTRPKKR